MKGVDIDDDDMPLMRQPTWIERWFWLVYLIDLALLATGVLWVELH